jgi:hypothetical protein
MKRNAKVPGTGAFTITEMMTCLVFAAFLGIAVFAMTNAAMMMMARNISVNLTNNSERRSLDRIEASIQQAYTMPVLINTSGASATSPAAGVSFDYFVGSPYVVTVTGGSLPSSTASLTLVRSTNSVACPPIPSINDVVMLNGAPSTVRALISAVSVGSTDGSLHQTITVTLASALGSAVSVPSSGTLTATLVHKLAYVVMAGGSGNELRFFPNFETTTNLNDRTKYLLVSDEIALQSSDTTPFSLTQNGTTNFVSMSLRVRSDEFDQRLSKKQADQFNTYARLDVAIRPKINPQ